MAAAQRPTREQFIAFWKDFDTCSWRKLIPYALYLGPLTIYAFLIRRFDTEGQFWLFTLIAALGYVVLFPWIAVRWYHKRFARFIRCHGCGDWFGQDASGAYFGPDPKFRRVIETGRCCNCGEQILPDRQNAA